MTAYRGTRGVTLLIFNLRARVRPVVNITSRPLYPPWKNTCAHRTGAPAWTFWRSDNYRTAVGIRSPNHPARRLLAVPTELTWLVIRHCTVCSAAFRSYRPNGGISSYLCSLHIRSQWRVLKATASLLCVITFKSMLSHMLLRCWKQKKQQIKWWKVVRTGHWTHPTA
jgi:hypothetical protein